MESLKEDLFRAYYNARQNKRNTWNQLRFEIEYETKLLEMYERIVKREYEICPSIAFIVDVPVKREIFAADFSDRVVHHLLFNYLNPILDAQFSEDSYSCRIGRGTHYGIKRVSDFMQECSENYTKDCYVLKLDVKGYFMGMNKHLLWEKLERMIKNFEDSEDSKNFEDDWDSKEKWAIIWYLLDKVIWNDPRQNCIFKGKM
jgi:hypothetical protein